MTLTKFTATACVGQQDNFPSANFDGWNSSGKSHLFFKSINETLLVSTENLLMFHLILPWPSLHPILLFLFFRLFGIGSFVFAFALMVCTFLAGWLLHTIHICSSVMSTKALISLSKAVAP